MYYAELRGTRLLTTLSSNVAVAPNDVQFSQNFKGTIYIQVSDQSGDPVDMTGWTGYAQILGGTGKSTGTLGSPEAAAFCALSYDSGSKTFSGILECNTSQMATLIGEDSSKKTEFAVKLVKDDASERFEVKTVCTAIAGDIDGVPQVAALGPVGFTVAAGQSQVTFSFPSLSPSASLTFVKFSPGPAVDFYAINENPEDATQNTVTVTLAGVAPTGGVLFKVFALAS